MFYPIAVDHLSPLSPAFYIDEPTSYNFNPILGVSLAHDIPFVNSPPLPKTISFSTSIPPKLLPFHIDIASVPRFPRPQPYPPGTDTKHRTWDPFVLPPLRKHLTFLRQFPNRSLPYFSAGSSDQSLLGKFDLLCFYQSSIKPLELFNYLFKTLWNFGCFVDLTPTAPFTIDDYLTFYTVALFKAYTKIPCVIRAILPWTCDPLSPLQKDALIAFHTQYVSRGNLPFLSPIPLAIHQYFSLLLYAKPAELLHFCTTSFQNWFVTP